MPAHNLSEELRFSYVTYIDYLMHGPLDEVTRDVPLLKGFNGNFSSKQEVKKFFNRAGRFNSAT